MTPKFHREWRTIHPNGSGFPTRYYDNLDLASADVERFPHRVVQHRLVSDWKDDQ